MYMNKKYSKNDAYHGRFNHQNTPKALDANGCIWDTFLGWLSRCAMLSYLLLLGKVIV